MVARGIPEKGWSEAIAAFKIVQKKAKKKVKVHLILVGDSDYLASLRENILRLPCGLNIHFIGYSLEPNYWIEAFDVGLLPSYFSGESLPNAIIEYLYMGKPVIATQVGGIPEMLSHDNELAGVTIPLSEEGKCDVIRLSQKMLEYSENNFLLEKHARLTSKVFEKFKMEKCHSKYESLFKQLIS